MLYAVIMAGGSGTRLWPLSRKGQPKQALKLIGERTMFQHSVDRLAPLFPPERIYVVTGAALADILRPQAPELPAANFIVEPAGRDSGPAAGLAAIHLLQQDPDAVMVMLTADHFILDTENFRSALEVAGRVAADGPIVTLGIRPTSPSTGFGYVELGEAWIMERGFRVYRSAGFTEKPDLQTALRFLEGGRHVWNSGMFVWRADRLMAELARQLPALHESLTRIVRAFGTPDAADVLRREWQDIQRISVDYGVMEHAEDVAVIPVEFGWSDIGSWASLFEVLQGDGAGNVVSGEFVSVDTANCFVRSHARLVAAIGLQDMIIVDTPDVLLICPKDRAQDVREIVNRLAVQEQLEYL